MRASSVALSNVTVARSYSCLLAGADDQFGVGAKAFNLGRMLRLGIPVPAGFVIRDHAFQEFLDHNDLKAAIARACAGLDPASPESLRQTAKAIRAMILDAEIPAPIREDIHRVRHETLDRVTLIVRSSAIGEDSEAASFAGQLDSILDVRSSAELDQAILTCWSSYWSERSLWYQLSRRVPLRGMGVIVQEMIRSRISGVLFTRPPSDSDQLCNRLLVEYCSGHGEALVSGQINPGRFTISRSNFSWQMEVSPEKPLQFAEEKMLFKAELIMALAETGMRLEETFGVPQDIEWTMDQEGRLFVVQCRPITALGPASASSVRPLHQPEPAAVIWSNANVNENFPAPISPLLYSIAATGYYYYFRNLAAAFGISSRRIHAMEHSLRNIIGVHGGRMYYNLTNIHSALRAAPFGERLIDDFNHFVGANEKAPSPSALDDDEHQSRWRQLTQWLELSRIALKTLWRYLFLKKRIESFEQAAVEFGERTSPEKLKERSLQELLGDFRAFLKIRFHRWTDAALADAASMACYGTLKRFINRAFPDADEAALHNTLLKGLSDIVSSVPAVKIWELSRMVRNDAALAELFATKTNDEIRSSLENDQRFADFHEALEQFIKNWGFRCSGELMLTVPSFQEDPAALIDILKGYAKTDGASPHEMILQQGNARAAEADRILSVLSPTRAIRFVPLLTKAHVAKLLLSWTHHAIALRERARLKQALLYSRCRRITLAMGERLTSGGFLERAEDVFFLTYLELDQLICGGAMFPYHTKDLLALRKKDHAELSAMCPPDTIALAAGNYWPNQNGTPLRPGEIKQAGEFAELTGTGACGGTQTGRATILNDISESRLLNPGDVLVTRQTDPGWGPVFFLIRGLVLERGGMLSHGAIIAREFGIPSVVGVKDATRLISQGQTITVDGGRGRVTIGG